MHHVLLGIGPCVHIGTNDVDEVLGHLLISMVRGKMDGRIAMISRHIRPIFIGLGVASGLIVEPCMLIDYFHRHKVVFERAVGEQRVLANINNFHDGALIFLIVESVKQIDELVLADVSEQSSRH